MSALHPGTGNRDTKGLAVPSSNIMISGGGYRAMVASTGYMKAMQETGALDCVTYTAGMWMDQSGCVDIIAYFAA